MTEKIIFLDRDGVINHDPIGDYIKTPEDFEFLPGVADSLKKLTNNGFKIIVISNQAGVGDDVFSEEALDKVHKRFLEMVQIAGSKITDTFYCLHGKQAGCDCRKPETGLFERAEESLGPLEKKQIYYIGDKTSDVLAAKRFGIKALFVLTGHGRNELETVKALDSKDKPEAIYEDLKTAVDRVVGEVS